MTKAVTRNDKTKTLIEKQIQKGDYKNTPYLGFEDITTENRPEMESFLGDDIVNKWLTNQLNQLCINAMRANATYGPPDEDGVKPVVSVDWNKVTEAIEELSVATETLGELKERKMEVLTQMQDFFGLVFGTPDKYYGEVFKGEVWTGTQEQQAKWDAKKTDAPIVLMNLKLEVKALDDQIAAREADFKARQDKKKLTEASKPVAAATQEAVAA